MILFPLMIPNLVIIICFPVVIPSIYPAQVFLFVWTLTNNFNLITRREVGGRGEGVVHEHWSYCNRKAIIENLSKILGDQNAPESELLIRISPQNPSHN